MYQRDGTLGRVTKEGGVAAAEGDGEETRCQA